MTQQQDCCMWQDPIIQQKGFEHPRKVAELEVSTAVLRLTHQYFRGYTILVLRQHAQELWQLDQETRQMFMEDANQMALALDKTFKPLKMNYSLLGNNDPIMDHLHWHLTPRRLTDPAPKRHISAAPFPEVSLSEEEFKQMADEIRRNL
jgi:diadenosine tetraphosphate (Ap4A) HIT family hydrolase